MPLSPQDVLRAVDEVIEDAERKMEQSIMNQSNIDGLVAYGQKAALSILKRRLAARMGLPIPSCVRLIRAR